MKRIFGSLQRRQSPAVSDTPARANDSPEGKVIAGVNAFCGFGRGKNDLGAEFVHLPAIVENAESSPNAARTAAIRIHELLADPAATSRVRHNAITLIRILADNPGYTFTRNLDDKFVTTAQDLLRQTKDVGVQSFLRETLTALEAKHPLDEGLGPLLLMWDAEKSGMGGADASPSQWPHYAQDAWQYQRSAESFVPGQALPSPDELATRISEAKTTAKLLTQFVESTPVTEVLNNELMNEFSDRCQSASRAVQSYIHSTNPAPDEDTLTTLIETSDELSVALSCHQRAMLKARKAANDDGLPSPVASSGATSVTGTSKPSIAGQPNTLFPSTSASTQAPGQSAEAAPSCEMAPYQYRSEDFQVQNPFVDGRPAETPTNSLQVNERPERTI